MQAYITRLPDGTWTVVRNIQDRRGETFQCRSTKDGERIAERKNHLLRELDLVKALNQVEDIRERMETDAEEIPEYGSEPARRHGIQLSF